MSRFFERPPYQEAWVPPGGRRVPDLAMVADSVPGMAIYCSVLGACRESTREFNPALYHPALRGAYRDITTGSNDIVGLGCCEAQPGYDMASGWGSPSVPELIDGLSGLWDPRRL